jgi:haloalkane dehalogenase
MEITRTPDERFADLPGYPWQPRYATTSDGLRLAAVDEGPRDGQTVLLLHGEPTWSYLYRKMIPVLLDAGLRVVAPDLIGFGRSDKPTRDEDYTYARHVEWLRSALFEPEPDGLDLSDVVLFCQDWGGLLGLRLLAEHPDRFSRVVAANTGLPDGSVRMPEAWWLFHEFVQKTPDLPIGFLVRSGCADGLPDDVAAAYDAPFHSVESKAGARRLPSLIPQTLDDPATPDNQRAWEVLRALDVPFLTAFSDSDPITAGGHAHLQKSIPGAKGQPHATIEGGGHFLQEDRGEQVARVVLDWLSTG